MTGPDLKANSTSQQGIENCRALDIGVEKFAECLHQGPSTCAYALPFGYCFLCTNPRLKEIIANTKKAQAGRQH